MGIGSGVAASGPSGMLAGPLLRKKRKNFQFLRIMTEPLLLGFGPRPLRFRACTWSGLGPGRDFIFPNRNPLRAGGLLQDETFQMGDDVRGRFGRNYGNNQTNYVI